MFNLDDYLPYLIRRIVPRIDEAFAHNLGAVDLTIEMWRVIISLYDRGPLSLTAVSELTSINLSTLSRLADRMQRKKLIRRVTRTKGSRRWAELELLPIGLRKCEMLVPEVIDFQKQVIAGFDASELAQIKELLRRLYTAFADVARERTESSRPERQLPLRMRSNVSRVDTAVSSRGTNRNKPLRISK